MKRLIRKAEVITHNFISPYWILIDNPETGNIDIVSPNSSYERKANNFMKKDFEEVKSIIIENIQDKNVNSIKNIEVNLNNSQLIATATFNEKPNKEILDIIANELESQYADGLGESLEQIPFATFKTDDGESYDTYLKLWNNNGFSMKY